MTRIPLTTLTLVSAALLVAQALPQAVTKTEVVRIPYKPTMFLDCELPAVEYQRICKARKQNKLKGT